MIIEPQYDDESLAAIRAGQEDPYVQYFIINKDLNMSPGKIAAQVAHAAQMFAFRFKDLFYYKEELNFDYSHKVFVASRWAEESFRKRIKVAHKNKFDRIKKELDCFLVRDAGLTEVESGSETVLALWPMKDSETPKIIKKLRLL